MDLDRPPMHSDQTGIGLDRTGVDPDSPEMDPDLFLIHPDSCGLAPEQMETRPARRPGVAAAAGEDELPPNPGASWAIYGPKRPDARLACFVPALYQSCDKIAPGPTYTP